MMREQLTEEDVKKIQEEIEYRKLVVRKEALEAVKEARAHGDLSENFEYHAAKKDKNKNESRIRYLERMLKTARIITDESQEDEVGLNNKVRTMRQKSINWSPPSGEIPWMAGSVWNRRWGKPSWGIRWGIRST